MFKYTKDMISFLEKIVPGKSFKEVTNLFNAEFNSTKTKSQIHAFCKRNKIKNNCLAHFPKGNIPYNKGKKGLTTVNKTSFKKGSIPVNYLPIGSERINSDGYIDIKINKNKWKAKHRILWEQQNGAIPRDSCLIFANKNKLDTSLDNLILIKKSELVVMNKLNLLTTNKDLTKAGNIVAKLKIKIRERELNKK